MAASDGDGLNDLLLSALLDADMWIVQAEHGGLRGAGLSAGPGPPAPRHPGLCFPLLGSLQSFHSPR